MPIKPENKDLYPPDWPFVRKRILERDKHKCVGCGLRDHSVGYRDEKGRFYGTGGNIIHDLAGDGLSYPSLMPLSYQEALLLAVLCNDYEQETGEHYIVIVLTIAHLDHNPENCSNNNLASLCQRCHNIYDRAHRNETMRQTRRKGQLELQFALNEN